MKQIIYLFAMLVFLGLSSIAHAKVGDLVNLEYAGNIYSGSALLGGGYWNSTSGYNTTITLNLSTSTARIPVVGPDMTFTNDSGTIISNTGKSSAMSGTSYATLYDGYMTESVGSGTITFSFLDPKATYELAVYSQQESGVPNKVLQINGLTVLTNDNSMSSFTSGVNNATITNLYSSNSGTLTISYLGSLNGLQLLQTGATGSAPAPEPASMVLMVVGGIFVFMYVRKSHSTSVFVA